MRYTSTQLSRTQRVLAAILLATAAASCSRDGTGPTAASCAETSSVDATISVGTSVTFNWAPACPVALVLVEQETSAHDAWWIATFAASDSDIAETTENRIVPPVTFGQVPSTATDSYGPEPLVAGTAYTLVLWRNLPTGSTLRCQENFGTACVLAVKRFTR